MEIEDGLRSQNAVWARHCQILWNSSRGRKVKEIAEILNWFPGSVRHILRTFNRDGLDAVRPRKRPGRTPLVKLLTDDTLEQLKDLAHQSPRNYGVDRAVWRSADIAEVAFREGILPS
ncbi:MAG: helix-turn-helix domain-containing protein [Lentisphaerae bacterium]|nr:helix-turn-helix domain-containing protein [Lentisphaerota bacterium]